MAATQQTIAALTLKVERLEREVFVQQARANAAFSEGLTHALVKSGRLEYAEAEIRQQLVEQMEPIIRKAAVQVLDAMTQISQRRYGHGRISDFALRQQLDGVFVLSGRIREIDWNMAVI